MAYEEEIMISTSEVAAFPMSLSPNPVRNMLSLDAENISYTYMYDMNGRLVLESDSTELDLTNLNPGSYVLKAINAEGKYVINKIVKL